jgi:hypothetical protein
VGTESTFYEIRARLVSANLEEDNDIHLVIKGVRTSICPKIPDLPGR